MGNADIIAIYMPEFKKGHACILESGMIHLMDALDVNSEQFDRFLSQIEQRKRDVES